MDLDDRGGDLLLDLDVGGAAHRCLDVELDLRPAVQGGQRSVRTQQQARRKAAHTLRLLAGGVFVMASVFAHAVRIDHALDRVARLDRCDGDT